MEKCISCSGVLKKIGENSGFEILQCNLCGLGKTQGSGVDYKDYHRDDVYIKEDKQFKNIFKKRLNTVLKFKNQGKVLDIGSSTGTLLSLFKEKGWEVQGIEPSKTSSKKAQDKGIPTINRVFEKANIQNNQYDVVVVNHVLEHTTEPVKFLEDIFKVLKKDGIVLIGVPNFGSYSAKTWGANWQYVLPEEHVWHFTSQSLANLLQKTGFTVTYKETHSGIWEYGSPLVELLNSFFGFKKRFFRNLITAIPSWIISKLNLGTGLITIAKK